MVVILALPGGLVDLPRVLRARVMRGREVEPALAPADERAAATGVTRER
jgi:hypothetical protein